MSRRPLIGLAIIVGIGALIAGCAGTSSAPAMDVASGIDLQRYSGRWYEIARLPNDFQKQCAGNVSADYEPMEDGRLRVTNRCALADGSEQSVEGVARMADDDPAKLEVRFAPSFMSWLPMVWGDYWILAVGPRYEYALVGEPSRANLWILSRTPTISDENYERLLKQAAKQGYDVTKVRRTPHDAMKTAAAGA